jgi:hypothetical protein
MRTAHSRIKKQATDFELHYNASIAIVYWKPCLYSKLVKINYAYRSFTDKNRQQIFNNITRHQ